MSDLMLRGGFWGVALAVVGAWSGCGKSDKGGTDGTAAASNNPPPVTAAINAQTAADEDDEDSEPDDPADAQAAKVELKEGSPEWLIREATKLRLQPPPKTDNLEQLKAHRKERNEKIVKFCQQAIAQVHSDAEKERLFTAAVHNMLEARLQLALAGDRDSTDALYEDAQALYSRDPKSAAAAEGAHALVNLAYSQSKVGTGNNRQWLGEFARQAAHFADNFPAEERRALPLLFTAAHSCDQAGMTKEAIDGYTLIQQKFPQSPYASRITAVLRRLKLIGNPPQLAGPTLGRDPVAVDDMLGSPVLVVFWSTESKPFVEGLPALLEVTRKHSKAGLKVIGVNLDADPVVTTDFVVKNRISWPQIVFKEPEKRLNNPIVAYYGIMENPTLWLIDHSGNVVSTSVPLEKLDDEVRKLIDAGATSPEQPAEQASDEAERAPVVKPQRTRPAKKSAPKEEEE